MLHEILLSLSGTPSPLWREIDEDAYTQDGGLQYRVSAPEKAMLASLLELSHLHIQLREAVSAVSASHHSLVCRAVSTSIYSQHLASFCKKIMDVETSILQKDSEFVGAYNIVPLSRLVTEFAPWLRLLQWLWKTIQFIQEEQPGRICTGAQLLSFLENERYTGFADIEQAATHLIVIGQQTWMRSLTPWVLFGKLLTSGEDDFMIRKTEPPLQDYELRKDLIPSFVTEEAADAICSIGKALDQLRSRDAARSSTVFEPDISGKLLSNSLSALEGLSFPLRYSTLEAVMFDINQSISENALSHLLPLNTILSLLSVVEDYLFLDNGEFALALISHAEDRIQARIKTQSSDRAVRKLGRLDAFDIKDSELTTILKKTWSELSALRSERESEDAIFREATFLLRLRNSNRGESAISTLLPVSTVLDLAIPIDSPLHIFLPQTDLALCSDINAYLLSIRRAEVKVSGLWKLTSHRRCHPTAIGPPLSASKAGQMALAGRRQRENARNVSLRRSWASISKALFVLTELDAYFHAEVIKNNYHHFRQWLKGRKSSRSSSVKSSSRPVTASSETQFSYSIDSQRADSKLSGRHFRSKKDPRMLAMAHHMCLENVANGLLLRHHGYVKSLTELLLVLDHFVAMFHRLQTVWEGLDLQEDDGVVDAFSNYAQDEKELLTEMNRVNDVLENLLPELVGKIKDVEKDSLLANMTTGVARIGLTNHENEFEPWRVRSIDRLLMKLDFLASQDDSDEDLVEYYDATT